MLGPLPFIPRSKGSPVISHFPVHLSSAHSFVKENGIPPFLARLLTPLISMTQGRYFRDLSLDFLPFLRFLSSMHLLQCRDFVFLGAMCPFLQGFPVK